MEFLDMNDDCLEHVFHFLDLKSVCTISETCKHLRRIAESCFKRHRYYKCHIGNEVNVKEATKIIRKIGQYLSRLHLDFHPIDPEVYGENGIGCRFLSLLNSSLGERFCELELSGGEISSFPVLRLAPTFLKLQKLTIYCEYGEDSDDNVYGKEYAATFIDLPQLCPNLRVLSIENCALIFAPNPNKSFRNLEALEFYSFGKYYPIALLECFFRQNKQLRKLYFDTIVDDIFSTTYIDLAIVADNLRDLEELRIRTNVFDNCVQAIRDISGMHHLTTLAISEYLDTIEDLNDILDALKTMKQLKAILIGWCFPDQIPNQQAIINIAKELKQLEIFHVDLQCDENTIVECVRFGRSLKRFRVEFRPDRVVTTTFIKHLAKVRESVAGSSHQPLLLYFAGAKLNGDVSKVIKEPDVTQHLKWKVMRDVSDDLFEQFTK
ncbi:hypothetical protein HA402_008373 [Bradysia odoriphaga]|nr:hypothetical protein HA402_008373 [Bradysia odoriphaga]